MIRELLLSLSTPVLAFLIVGGSVSVMVWATWFLRRRYSHAVHSANNEVAGFMFAGVAAIYGVLLAFIVIAMWQTFAETRRTVEGEANALVDLYRFADELPAPLGGELRAAVKTYTLSIINDEWNTMQLGTPSPATNTALDAIWRVHAEFHLRPVAPGAPTGNFFPALTAIGNYRRLRLDESRTELDPLFWILLWGGGMITLGFTLFFRSPNERAHYLMVAMLTAIVAFVLFLIIELDNPFTGSVHITPRALYEALETFQQLGN